MENNLPIPLRLNNPFKIRQFNYEGIIGRSYCYYHFSAPRYGLRAAALCIVRLYFKKIKYSLVDILSCLPCVDCCVLPCVNYLSERLMIRGDEDIMLGISDQQLDCLRSIILNIITFLYGDKFVYDWFDFESLDYAIMSAKLEMIYKYHQ